MEYWSNGVLRCCATGFPNTPSLHHSITPSLHSARLFRLHLPDAFPIGKRRGGKLGATRGERAAGAVVEFIREFFKLPLRVDELAKGVFVVGGFVAAAQLGIISRRAGIFTLVEFHWRALALDDDAIHESSHTLSAELRGGLARDQQPRAIIFRERFDPGCLIDRVAHQPIIEPPG